MEIKSKAKDLPYKKSPYIPLYQGGNKMGDFS